MKSASHKIRSLLHGPDQFVIPLFQRTYVWRTANWQRLWNDLSSLRAPGAPGEHFMGSLVCMPGPQNQPGKPPQYLVIDGQQRLMTFYLLLCAMRDDAVERGAPDIAEPIKNLYLLHQYQQGLDRYKVLPRLRDRHDLLAIADGGQAGSDSRIRRAYAFFREQLDNAGQPGSADALRELFYAATEKLSLVLITLEEENAFQIFETLNSTGQPLNQADLIRNHVFMAVPLDQQDAFDDHHWLPLEESVEKIVAPRPVALEDFYRDSLMTTGTYVRPDSVYATFKEHTLTAKSSPSEVVERFRNSARHYKWLYQPSEAPKPLRDPLDYLRRLDVGTTRPLVLHLLEQHRLGLLDESDLLKCLRYVLSFVIRRAITGDSTRGYGPLFAAAVRALEPEDLVGSLERYLAQRGWPSDNRFTEALVTFPIYTRAPDLARVLLIAAESATGHKELVDVAKGLDTGTVQLEHVLPQTLGENEHGLSWKEALGVTWSESHERWVHTLGNLTLTGYNPSLSNHSFASKRAELANSNIVLNRHFKDLSTWNGETIEARARELAKQVVALWPAPIGAPEAETLDDTDSANPGEAAGAQHTPWRPESIRLAVEESSPAMRRFLRYHAERPGEWIRLPEATTACGVHKRSISGMLAGLSQRRKKRYHETSSLLRWRWEDGTHWFALSSYAAKHVLETLTSAE